MTTKYVIYDNDENGYQCILTSESLLEEATKNVTPKIFSAGNMELDNGFVKCSGTATIAGKEHFSNGPIDEAIILGLLGTRHG